jgi:hypothetical protein
MSNLFPIPNDNVRFVGVIANDDRLQHTNVPSEYQDNLLIRGQYFYTVPQQLLLAISPMDTKDIFECDDQLIQMEAVLSDIAQDHSSIVGFWNNQPIKNDLLMCTPIDRALVPGLDSLPEDEAKKKLADINKRLLSFHEISCAYAGWLMQNSKFVSEFAELISNYLSEISSWGFANVGLPVPSRQPLAIEAPSDQPRWGEYEAAALAFCMRWRLQGLAGPRLPVPMRPMMSGNFSLAIVEQLMRAGGVFNWPDTFPLFARDQLRDLIRDALSSSQDTEHLHEWKSIISSDNKAKNQFATFERLFRFQHFWRLLRERHSNAFIRRINVIEQAFADYLGVSPATIANDRKKLQMQLGSDWDLPKN